VTLLNLLFTICAHTIDAMARYADDVFAVRGDV
jgi:hypothetical protein